MRRLEELLQTCTSGHCQCTSSGIPSLLIIPHLIFMAVRRSGTVLKAPRAAPPHTLVTVVLLLTNRPAHARSRALHCNSQPVEGSTIPPPSAPFPLSAHAAYTSGHGRYSDNCPGGDGITLPWGVSRGREGACRGRGTSVERRAKFAASRDDGIIVRATGTACQRCGDV